MCRARNTALSNCLLPCRPPFDPPPRPRLRFLETAAPLPDLYRRRTVIQRSASLISCFPFIHRGICVSTIARYHEYCTWPSCLAPSLPDHSEEAPSMGHRWWWFLGGDEKKRGNVEWMVSPACSLRKLNLDRASEGNGFGVRVCVCGYRVRNFIKGPFLG